MCFNIIREGDHYICIYKDEKIFVKEINKSGNKVYLSDENGKILIVIKILDDYKLLVRIGEMFSVIVNIDPSIRSVLKI